MRSTYSSEHNLVRECKRQEALACFKVCSALKPKPWPKLTYLKTLSPKRGTRAIQMN